MPPDQIPSLQKYLDDHGVGSIFWRLFNGSKRILQLGCFGYKRMYAYGYCSQISLGFLAIAISTPLLLRRKPRRHHLDDAHIAFYVLAVFASLGAAWYLPITGNTGARIILVLFIPILWTVGLVVHKPHIRSLQIRVLGRQLNFFSLMMGLMSLSLAYEIYMMVTVRAATSFGGS